MTAGVRTALAEIEEGLRRLDRRILMRSLQPGISSSAVIGALAEAGLTASPDLISLYGWKNGTAIGVGPAGDLHLFPGFYFLSVEHAIADYRAFEPDPRWRPGWLPILANGGGDSYVVDLSSPDAGAVRHFRIDESEQPVEFDSLRAFLGTIAAGFEQNVFFVDSAGYLEMDDEVFTRLAAELNPDVDWWQD